MSTRPSPPASDDVRSLSAIALGALAGTFVTAALVLPTAARYANPGAPAPDLPTVEVRALPPAVDPAAGADRLYGTVTTRDGGVLEGHLRLGEGQLGTADVLRASQTDSRAIAGMRLAHVARIDAVDGQVLRLTLRSGATASVRRTGMIQREPADRVVVETVTEGDIEVAWSRVASVDLRPEPEELAPRAERLHGTLTTRSGRTFTGWLTLGGNASRTSDAVEGGLLGGGERIGLGKVASVRRVPGGAEVSARDGTVWALSGPARSDRAPRIAVSDPGLGTVDVPWLQVESLRLHPPAGDVRSLAVADRLWGTVHLDNGASATGDVTWDADESWTWQTLDGQDDGIQYHVELGRVRAVRKHRMGAQVELLDGRVLYLMASNDVNWANRGILVENERGTAAVDWDQFRELVLEPARPLG